MMHRSAQNRINQLVLEDGSIITEEGALKDTIISYYRHLRGCSSHNCIPYERYASLFHKDVSALVNTSIKRVDILRVLKGFNDFKAPKARRM